MRIAQIARFDNSGLGNLCWEFARHLKPKKVLLVENFVHQTFPERYAEFDTRQVKAMLTPDIIEWLFKDIDILFTAETFYDWSLIKYARIRNVKTALLTMYEMTEDPMKLTPDLLICPSKLDYEVFKDYSTKVVYLPLPIATDRLVWKERKKAEVFIHSASHGGVNFRKGTKLLLDAIPLVKNPNVKFKVFTWNDIALSFSDPRLEVKKVNFKNYWQIWREGDALIYPQDYNGICLPVMEAFASGLGVVSTNIFPFNEYLPKRLLFPPSSFYRTRAGGNLLEVEAAKIDPQEIAKKIDEVSEMDISEESNKGREWAEENSWDILLPQYEEVFRNLIV